jgi:tetratricopeptide (TPR) repeat protein
VPQTPSPTFVADRFWERGDFEAALEEYRALLVDFGISERAKEIRLRIVDCLVRLGRYEQAMIAIQEAIGSRGKDEFFESRKLFIEGIVRRGLGTEEAADSVYALLAMQYPGSPANLSAMASAMARIASYIETAKLDFAEREIDLFTGHYDRYGDLWGRLSMMVIERYVKAALLDSAAAIAQRIIALQDKNSEIYIKAKTALARIFLDKGRKDRANDLFNQCITAHLSSEGVWESWMGLANIYEYEFQYPDAAVIYQKVFRECPATLRVHWMAALKLGELASRDSTRNFEKYFETVVQAGHPFPLPRLIARFYLGEADESQFKAAWNRFYHDDFQYLYYCARKAMFRNEEVVARIYLQELIQNLPSESWNFIMASRAMNNLKKW